MKRRNFISSRIAAVSVSLCLFSMAIGQSGSYDVAAITMYLKKNRNQTI